MKSSDKVISKLGTAVLVAVGVAACAAGPAGGNELRLSSLAGSGLTVVDRDSGIDPYDFGRNPAWLYRDYEYDWIRFFFGGGEERGGLRRTFDPQSVTDLYSGFTGVKSLGGRHVVSGKFTYQRLLDAGVERSLEIDQYNDPFYLTDFSTGGIEYYGPLTSVDYGFRISDRLLLGAGFDYNICTGLKDQYTRPQIIHNYFVGHFGLARVLSDTWVMGLVFRPVRIQNRTDFDKTDEGFDNVVRAYAGDGIYEVRAFSSYTIREILHGYETAVQAFYDGGGLVAGINAGFSQSENEIEYGSTYRYEKGYWKRDVFDAELRARYRADGSPLVLGIGGGISIDDGWALRPDFEEVLLYDNPYRAYTGTAGISYDIEAAQLTLSGEYTLRKFDIEASDYGASLFRESDIVQNVGRLSVEKRIFNIYSFRTGIEITDFPIDRWLKMPANMDRYRYTAGFGMYTGSWEIDMHLEYSRSGADYTDEIREGLSGAVWFTRIVQ